MKTTFIYTLSDPRSHAVRYVGKTDTPLSRFKTHLRCRDNTIRSKWIGSLLAVGAIPVLEVLDEVPFKDWMFWEQHWIQVMRGWGFDLVNGDNGGLGHYRLPEHVARKISETLKGRRLPQRWKQVSAYSLDGKFVKTYACALDAAQDTGAHSANIRRAIKANRSAVGLLWAFGELPSIDSPYINGRIPTSEKRRLASVAIGRAKKGTKLSLEARQKMSLAARRKFASGWTPSAEAIAKMSAASKTWWRSRGGV